MDENELLEIAVMCREASSIVPTNKAEDEANAGKMFAQLHAIAVVCMDGHGLSPELRKVVPVSKQGELHIAVSAINQTRIFSNDKAPVVKSQLAQIEAILTDAALRLKGTSTARTHHNPLPISSSTIMDIFISHSNKDADIAEALIDFIRAAIQIPHDRIRCTSVDGYRLPGGASTDEQLKREVRESDFFIGLLTPVSLKSSYVLFELGARWGAQLPFVPLLSRGVEAQHLPGPLSGINAHRCDSIPHLHQLVREIADKLNKPLGNAAAYDKHLQKLMLVSRPIEHVENLNTSSSNQTIGPGYNTPMGLTAPSTQAGKEILELIRKETDPDVRGLLEIFDSPVIGHVAFLPNTTGSGGAMTVKTRLFREAIEDLVSKGWLYPPEDDGKTRIYDYKGPEDVAT